ncbi:MAG: tRNA (guanosine(46)-N7)-methyltransferase TrmB [Treponemataceae bacterium]|nr:tRNA (guanosine(46)-N7)-methyltransferase TrmB [Treponemataceae bacterium]
MNNEESQEENPFMRTIHTFVLRQGRMTEGQKRDYETLSARWCIPFTKANLNYIDVFDNLNPVTIEIGFGMGKATAIIAEENPDKNYIGLEVHKPGVGKLLGEIRDKNLQNLYIIEHDALEVLDYMISDNSVNAFHIFFPDPWPKKKHHKRRLVQRPRTDLLAKKLAPGGYIYMATDWEPYADFAMEELLATPGIHNAYEGFAPHQEWRPETKFEAKGVNADRKIKELFFVKNND